MAENTLLRGLGGAVGTRIRSDSVGDVSYQVCHNVQRYWVVVLCCNIQTYWTVVPCNIKYCSVLE